MRDMKALFVMMIPLAALHVPVLGAVGSSAYPRMESAFDIPRSDAEDVIYFRSEDVLQGQLLSEKIGLVTPYGMLSIPLRRCAGLSFDVARTPRDAVVTVNFNRLSGMITDHVFRFRIGSSGTVVPIRKETVAYMVLRKTAEETDFLKDSEKPDLFVMANGDLLTGKAAEQTVDIRTDYGKVAVSFGEIKDVRLLPEGDITAIITKTTGNPIRGACETNELSLSLEMGQILPAVYKDQFARILVGRARDLAPAQFGVRPAAGEGVPNAEFRVGGPEPEAGLSGKAALLDEPTLTLDLGKQATMKLALIPAGKFLMGSLADEASRDEDEGPPREVVLSQSFYLGVHEVTQGQYEAIMGTNPSKFIDAAKPVESVSWEDAVEFCRRVSRRTHQSVALPTEAQWEYACRAGSKMRFGFGDDDRQLSTYARYGQGAEAGTVAVGSKKPSAWGLYDMHGNVWEWCADWYTSSYVNAATQDPTGPLSGQWRVLRGGSWVNTWDGCRCAARNKSAPDVRYNGLGFRVIVKVR
ncbi:MAG: formylglycine-generating enzyme family protein [Planctomycetes bacterium]|nr:formylglycine-generating enzyme family protein [Planctomycetota bacterium]